MIDAALATTEAEVATLEAFSAVSDVTLARLPANSIALLAACEAIAAVELA